MNDMQLGFAIAGLVGFVALGVGLNLALSKNRGPGLGAIIGLLGLVLALGGIGGFWATGIDAMAAAQEAAGLEASR